MGGARYDGTLVATDGGKLARAASRHALTLSSAFDATVHALSVVNTSIAGDYPSKRTAAADAVVSVNESATEADIDCITAIREGTRPSVEITDYRRRHDLDLIVLGTHGRSGVKRYLLGSVAEQVVRSARVPVLVIPPTDTEARSPPHGSVLLSIDESEAAETAARHGLRIADRFGADVITLHADDVENADDRDPSDERTGAGSIDRVLTRITDRARDAHLDATDRRYDGDPVGAITTVIDEYSVDLVAIGTHGASSVKRLVLGSLTERVLRNVHVPILAVPPHD